MENNNVDFSSEIGYNVLNDENGGLENLAETQIVKMDEHDPVNDVKCTHETLIPDPTDTIGEAVYHGCANWKCGRGWYVTPNKNIT